MVRRTNPRVFVMENVPELLTSDEFVDFRAKAMLAYIPPEEAEHHLRAATWERYTDQTITSSEEMWSVLRAVSEARMGV